MSYNHGMQSHGKQRPSEGTLSHGERLLQQLRLGRGARSQRRDWLRDALVIYRSCGIVYFAVQQEDEDPPYGDQHGRLDRLAERLHLAPLGDGWREVSREFGERHLTHVLGHSLAHPGAAVMPDELAAELTAFFYQLLDPSARAFTNFQSLHDPSAPWLSTATSWTGLTPSTFDTGLALLDPHQTAILWLAEED